MRNGCYRTKKNQPNPLESLASLRNQNPSLPAADKHPYKAAVTTATAKPLIKDIRAGLAPIPIALSVIGLNWSAQVNFVQGVEKPKPSCRGDRDAGLPVGCCECLLHCKGKTGSFEVLLSNLSQPSPFQTPPGQTLPDPPCRRARVLPKRGKKTRERGWASGRSLSFLLL